MSKRKCDEAMNGNISKQPKLLHNSVLSGDGTLAFDFMISLENIAVARIVSNLWTRRDTQQEIVNLFRGDIKPGQSGFDDKWQQIENNVVAAASELYSVYSITEKLISTVPPTGNFIRNWIEYHDEHVFNTNKYSEYSAADFINNIIWTTRGRVSYSQTAASILAHNDCGLSDDHKYKLACTYCFEDAIAALAPTVVDRCYLNSVEMDIHPMVYFWTAHITRDDTKLCNPSYEWHYNKRKNGVSINEHIIQLLVNNNSRVRKTLNETPIKYMWSKLSEEEKTRNIKLVVNNVGNQDLRYSLLSNLDYEQQQEVLKECSCSLLDGVLDDWLWRCYFLPTALYIIEDDVRAESFLYILERVIEKMRAHYQEGYAHNPYKLMFKKIWQKGSGRSKGFVFDHDDGRTLESLVTSSLSWKRDIDVIDLIFNDLSTLQKKAIIFGYCGIRHCAHLIQSDQWHLLELFIKYTLASDEDICRLKQILVKDKGREIADYFLEQEALDEIEYFMNWAFKSTGEVDRFRQSFAHAKFDSVSRSVIANNKVDFSGLETHFKWCAKEKSMLINQFKAGIPELHCGAKLISSLIQLDKYELLDQVLNWCFSNNQKQITLFKTNMCKSNLKVNVRSLTLNLIFQDNSFKLLDKFMDWCFTNVEEVQNFKTWILYPQDDSYSMCTDFIIECQLDLADKFIERCIISSTEITNFKRTLMLSRDMKYIFDGYFEEEAQDDLPVLIKWFNPSKEIAAEFKKLFDEKTCPDNFYKLLDKFVQNQSNLAEIIEEHSVRELQVRLDDQNCH